MPSALFAAVHRAGRNPSQRFRFEQYLPDLEAAGIRCELSPVVTPEDDAYLYRPGHLLRKIGFVRRCFAKRRRDLHRLRDFDLLFIQREALQTRSTFFERGARRLGIPIIFDFDDSVWLQNVSDANRRWAWVKDPAKTSKLIALADRVVAGNDYLAAYARRFNSRVEVIPTTIDTDEYLPRAERPEGPVVIGWSGSITTIQHFQLAIPALREVKARYGPRVAFRVIGDGDYRLPELGIEGLPWRRDTELDDLRAIDIGIMPLPDDEWARGKCGLKGLQYMALAIPALMSPVGVNTRIVTDGVDGFLPRGTEEWVARLAALIEDPHLRARMGRAARGTVEQRWSRKAWRQRYIDLFNGLIQQP